MPDAPAPGCDFSNTTTSDPDPAPRSRSSDARWYAVERPCIPAPTTTYAACRGTDIYCLLTNTVASGTTEATTARRGSLAGDPHETRRLLADAPGGLPVAAPAHPAGVRSEDEQAGKPLSDELHQRGQWTGAHDPQALDGDSERVGELGGRAQRRVDVLEDDGLGSPRERHRTDRELDEVDEQEILARLDGGVHGQLGRVRAYRDVERHEHHRPRCGCRVARVDDSLVAVDDLHSGVSSQLRVLCLASFAARSRTFGSTNRAYAKTRTKRSSPYCRPTKRASGMSAAAKTSGGPSAIRR